MTVIVPDGKFTGATTRQRLVAGITLAETTYASGHTVAAHAHPTTLVALTLDGQMNELRGRAVVPCPAGTLLVHPREEQHAHRFESGGRLFLMQLGTDWMQRMKSLGIAEPSSPLDLRRSRANAIVGELYAEFLQADNASELGIEGYALAMLGELARGQARGERSTRPPWLRRAADLLQASVDGGVELGAIAAEVNVSPVHLARSFKAHFGTTMGEYLRRLRVERARKQLVSTTKTLGQIAFEAGFADQAHFTRTFRHMVGVTPGAYRLTMGVAAAG